MTKNCETLRSKTLKPSASALLQTQQAEGLMQQVRALGRMPKESHDPKERRLARELRDARAFGLMTPMSQNWRALRP